MGGATCAIADEPRALDSVASLRPILTSPGSANCANTTATLPLTTGVAHTTAILRAIGVFYISLSTPITSLDIMQCANSCSPRKAKPTPHTRSIRTLTVTTGLACHHGNWDLGLGFGTSLVWDLVLVLSWSGIWVWDLVNFGRPWNGLVALETPHLGPRKLQTQKFGFNFLCWLIVDRTSPGNDLSNVQLTELWDNSVGRSLLILY